MESIVLDPIKFLSENLGASDPTIRLLLTLFAGYPLAFLYRGFIHGQDANIQHRFFTMCGLSLIYFNFGGDSIHSIVNITIIWMLLKVLGGTAISVVLSFVINTGYLLSAYIHVTGDHYDISWATPHCVLALRLTGVVFDVYDGKKKMEKLSREQKETALTTTPSLLEMAAHVYFFGGFLVGPQFSMKRYKNFVEGTYRDDHVKGPPNNVKFALLRLLLGVVYIAVFQVFSALYFTNSYMLTQRFRNLGVLSQCIYIMIWGKLHICKYVGCWLVAEGSCMLTGLTYNGKDINGNTLWNGCSNAKIYELESSTTFREMISGFNVNTNEWMSRYVFKRLRFLGNVQISQSLTLLYLSVWHGLHSGYYMNFFLEFIMLNGETQLASVLKRIPSIQQTCDHPYVKPIVFTTKKLLLQFLVSYYEKQQESMLASVLKRIPSIQETCDHPYVKPIVFTTKKLLLQFFVSYALVSFVHLKWERYSQVYSSVFYIGHVIFIVLPLLCVILKLFLSPKKSHTNGVHHIRNSDGAQIPKGDKLKVN